MDGGGKRNRVYPNLRTRPYDDRICERQSSLSNLLTNIESLPDELVFRILLELDAREIYESALFVCRKWYHMIHTDDFIHAHLQHSTPGLLIDYFCKGTADGPTFLTLRGEKVETFKLGYEFKVFNWNTYWNTCNGLILGLNRGDGFRMCIFNPATKQRMALPASPTPPDQVGAYLYSGIGYAPPSMKYKVVCSIIKRNIIHGCAIFTVGVDTSWRNVDMQHISHTASKILFSVPLIIEGIVYWTTPRGTSLLSLNLESEIITEIHIPQGCEYRKNFFLSTWSSLTLLVESSSSGFSWDVWELKKPETGGEWKRLPNIDLEAQKCIVDQLPYENIYPPWKLHLKPVGWLNYGELLVLRVSRRTKVCLLYNVVTQQTHFHELDDYTQADCCLPYKNSLVRVDGCS